MVLLLSHGFMTGHARNNAGTLVAPAPPEPRDFGVPATFVPQKARARKRVVASVSVAGLLVLAWVCYLFV